MFSNVFDPAHYRQLLDTAEGTLEAVLRKEEPTLEDAARLLTLGADPSARPRIVRAAAESRAVRWGGKLFLMPPLYISDGDPAGGGCKDHCGYCPWRNGNVPADKLVRLTADEIAAEARHLLGMGYADIELVAATDPELLRGDGAARAVEATKRAGARNVGINFFPLGRSEQYAAAVEAGCTFVIVWQETYDPEIYGPVHAGGPKGSMKYRLDAHDRALLGGMSTVGVAFLGGLADWRYDALATIHHALYLREEYGANIIFGMPRLKGKPENVVLHPFSDEEYALVGAVYSLILPEALPWFSTREQFQLSADAARGGGCLFTLDCSTAVGGYTKSEGFAQFPVFSRDISVGLPWLREQGFVPEIELPWETPAPARKLA